MSYKILIDDNNYEKWHFIDPLSGNIIVGNELLDEISPVNNKLFTRDYIDIVDGNVSIQRSYYRETQIPGVILLNGNKTYGRLGKRLLYKCIPDDRRIPHFLIPYDMKTNFNKDYKDKYVIFKYNHWDNKHPYGVLTETVGDVDILENFYEYQLYCNNLHMSISSFNKDVKRVLTKENDIIHHIQNKHEFKDHRQKYVFSIDPANSTDFDDAFCIEAHDTHTTMFVYISDVVDIIDYLDLWKSLSERVSTIYLPDKRRPMLPAMLSDSICSLQKDNDRLAVCFEFRFDKNNTIEYSGIYRATINVNENFEYDEKKLLTNRTFKKLLEFTNSMGTDISNSHDVVPFWMIYTNKHCSNHLLSHKTGVFRSSQYINKDVNRALTGTNISKKESTVIQHWNNVIGHYIYYTEDENISHEVMNNSNYVHATSPIRRLVDILNHIDMFYNLGLCLNDNAKWFHNHWIDKLDYLNTATRSIRKVQNECSLLDLCYKNPKVVEKTYKCLLFDKIQKTDGSFSYVVFIEEMNMMSKYISFEDMDNYSHHNFKLYLFCDEYKLKQKIKLEKI
jgi:hypothetical protein